MAGAHYKDMAIPPIEFCHRNGLNACETHAISYIVRHRLKGGAMDIDKAIHMLQILKELEYGKEVQVEVREGSVVGTQEDLRLREGSVTVPETSDKT